MFIYTIKDVGFMIFVIVDILLILGLWIYGCYIGWREKRAKKREKKKGKRNHDIRRRY